MLIPLFYVFCIASIHLAYKSTKRLRCLPLWPEMTRPSRKMIRRMLLLRKDNVCYLLQFSLDWVPVTVNIYYDIKSSNLETACLGILYLRKTTHDPMTATCKWAFKNISRDISSLSIYVLYEENSCNKPRYQHWMTTRWIIHCSLIPTSQTGTWQNNHSWFHGLTWSCC